MDVSKDYVLMCEKAVEVQEDWVPMRGDRVALYDNSKLERKEDIIRFLMQEEADSICAWKMGSRKFDVTKQTIFCPRQGQLHNLLEYHDTAQLINSIYVFHHGRRFDSMEQLWLAFVMVEKYQKRWVNNEWVKGDI